MYRNNRKANRLNSVLLEHCITMCNAKISAQRWRALMASGGIVLVALTLIKRHFNRVFGFHDNDII